MFALGQHFSESAPSPLLFLFLQVLKVCLKKKLKEKKEKNYAGGDCVCFVLFCSVLFCFVLELEGPEVEWPHFIQGNARVGRLW